MKWSWLIAAGTAGAVSISLLANGCTTTNPPELSGGNGDSGLHGSGACSPEGATQSCRATINQHDGVTNCFAGTQRCQNGVWSACSGAGTLTGQSVTPGQSVVATATPALAHHFEAESDDAHAALLALASRFPLAARATKPRFEADGGGLRAVFDSSAARAVAADVVLPRAANGEVRLRARQGGVAIAFHLVGAAPSTFAQSDGSALYPAAYDGADLVHRIDPSGTEDLLYFAHKPKVEELRYEVDVREVAGLRLVASTLELLDADGTPRLRVAPPYVIGADGARRAARLSVVGCQVDTSPRAPWGRAVTAPGASSCSVRVAWSAPTPLTYPALVDPMWTATGSMAAQRAFHTASLLSTGKVLVAGGTDTTPLASAELYDPSSGSWAATSSMSTARRRHTAVVLPFGSLVFVAGGFDGVSTLASAETYNPANGTWLVSGATLATPRRRHSATALSSGKVLLTGGYDSAGAALASAELYDPGADTFTTTGNMSSARYDHASLTIASGRVLVAGGNDGSATLASAETFDESSGVFTATAGPMVTPRMGHRMLLLPSGKALLTGGLDASGNPQASASLFDPAGGADGGSSSGTFTATGAMVTARAYHFLALLPNGQAILGGGQTTAAGASTSSSELYTPSSGSFSAGSAMNAARAGATATLLPNAKVLVSGGASSATTFLASAELLGVEDGGDCAANADCISGICDATHNVCCAAACSGACMGCQPTTGACTAITNGYDKSCNGGVGKWCNALGKCTVPDPNCTGNPCDPSCRADSLDAGQATASLDGGSFVTGAGGSNTGGSPPGFVSKELCTPCTGPFPQSCGAFTHYNKYDACESDYHCDSTTSQCVQNTPGWTWPAALCSGVDLTAQGSCTDPSSGLQGFPMCNRGNTALPAGTTVSIYTVNGNQWSMPASGCPSLGTRCSWTTPSALAPGTCQLVTSCSWNGNTVAFVNANGAVPECGYPNAPGCSDNWADVKSGGTCTTVQQYQPRVLINQYVASCPSGTHARWQLLSWSTTMPSPQNGANIVFAAQTAPIETDGGVGAFTPFVTLGTAGNPDPAICQTGDTSPCPKDMYAILGLPAATNEVLNLQITINPTADQQSTPTLGSYDLTYSCPPSE